MAGEGPIVRHSEFGQAATVARLEAAIRANGMCVFARIDHTASAAEEGVSLPPTVVLVFGIGRGVASLVGAIPRLAAELAFRALVWEDDKGETWLSCDDPRGLAVQFKGRPDIECALVAVAIRIESIVRKTVLPP